MKRPYRSPDGHDWRDPSMPAHRNKRGGEIVELSPERSTKVAQAYVTASHVPNWRDDPTYNLRRSNVKTKST